MAQVNFRIDDETKRRADKLFADLGMTMSGAITIFIKHSLDYQGLPFAVQKRDPTALPMAELLRRIDDVEHGRNCHEHTDEEAERLSAKSETLQNAKRHARAKHRDPKRSSARRRRSA